MAGKKVTYEIGVDSSKGVTGVQKFSSAVRKELKSIEGDFDDTATAGERVATVLSRMAGELDTELDRAAQAAEALRAALGEDLASRADVGAIVGDLQKMGLSFEEIVVDADKLAASLKELDQVQVKGLDSGLGGVDTKMGKLRDSSDQTKSVLANLAGNTAQDLGQIGGFAGSAGVAIGQLAEYATEGGIALKSLVGLAAPMIAMTVTAKELASHFGNIAETKAFNKEQIEGFSESLEDGATSAEAIAQHLEDAGKVEFRLFDETQDLGGNLAALGLTVDQFSELAAGDAEDIQAWGDAMIDAGASSKDVNLVMLAATKTAENMAGAHELAAENLKIFKQELDPEDIEAATRAYLKLQDPIKQLPDEFLRIGEAIATGFQPTAADLEKIENELGIKMPEALALGEQAWLDHETAVQNATDATNAAIAESKQFVDDWIAAIVDGALQIAGTESDMRDLAGVFEQIGVKGEALQRIFDLQNAPIDAEAAVRDIELAIDDLSTAAEGIDLSEGLDPSNVKADSLLDAIDSLRPAIQQRVTDAFSTGGPEAARNMARKYIIEVAEQLGISQIDAAKLLGMEDEDVLIHVAIEQESLDNAKSQLAILTGLTGETPLTASIALALETGKITPEQAQILAQDQLGDLGVDIPAALKVKTTKKELADAYKAVGIDPEKAMEQPLEVVPTGLRSAADTIEAGPNGRGWPAIRVPVQPVLAGTSTPVPYTPGPGFGPFSVEPAGLSATTNGATAAPMLASGGMSPLMLPVAAPSGRTVVINVALNAGTIGGPYDVMRAVETTMRQAARLMPRTP